MSSLGAIRGAPLLHCVASIGIQADLAPPTGPPLLRHSRRRHATPRKKDAPQVHSVGKQPLAEFTPYIISSHAEAAWSCSL